jgi:hypothetical protein
MPDPAACERRVYRLATLLTGNPNAATKVIEQVVGAQPDLRRLDSAHLDRLTVLRSREIKPGRIVADGVRPEIAAALEGLSPQQREAWVFHHVYRMDARDAAKAMDCSHVAAERHLAAADDVVMRAIGGSHGAGAMLLKYTMSLDVPEFYRMRARRRMRWRWVKRIVLLLILLGAIIGIVLLLEHFGVFDPLINPD